MLNKCLSLFLILSIAVFLMAGCGDEGPQTNETNETNALPKLTEKQMAQAKEIYFDRCAGCHGMLRKGTTGKNIEPKRAREMGVEGIKAIVTNGLPGGMPDWGKSGIMSEPEIDLIAKFLQHDPPAPPEMSLAQMEKSWKTFVPVEKRPKDKPDHNMNWQNFMGVILRDAGKVAIIDGDTKELVNVVETGFAVHILRSSATGRYFYSIGRDGKVTMIDLWMKKPDKVAEIKTCYDARSLDSSKYHGEKGDFRDKYIVVGGYWPPSAIILDGITLKPLKIVSTSGYTNDTNEFLREARVAAIVSSHHNPEWVINIKETGYIWLMDYTDITNLKISSISTDRFLHDGGWDSTKRYVLMATNARNKVAIVDTITKKVKGIVETGIKPHPGRGANIDHPKYGPIWCTGHLGDNTIACIGTDEKGHKENAWKKVATIELPNPGGGNLFIKTHPNSKWLWADRALHPNSDVHRSLFVINKETLKMEKTIRIPKKYEARAVHLEYNKDGDEVWVSAWAPKDKTSAILIYNDKTLELKKTIEGDWCITPTGKFNVYNTTKDIY